MQGVFRRMERRIPIHRRVALALMTCAVLLSGVQMANADDPDPTTTLIDTLLPVTNVVATGISPTQIFVSWTSTSPLSTLFRIEMSFDQFGPFTQVAVAPACGPDQRRGTNPICTTAFLTGPPSDPTPRWIRVVPVLALNGTGVSGLDGTEILIGNPSDPDPAVLSPPPPTNLKCNGDGPSSTACFNVSDVELTWTDNSDEANFWIMRAPNSSQPCRSKPWGTKPHAELEANVTKFEEHIPEFNAVFYYKVVALRVVPLIKVVDGVNKIVEERSYSDSVNPECIKVITPPKAPPTAPTGLTGTLIPPNTVHLTWTDLEPNPLANYIEEDGFFIEFGSGSSDYQTLTAVPQNPGQGTVSYDDRIPTDTTRCYRVRAYRNGPAYSKFTNHVCIGALPKAPTGLSARAVSNTQVDLSWTDNANTETSFEIERCPGICLQSSAGWANVGSNDPDDTTFSDMTTVASTTYSYRVRAKNTSGVSAPTNIATVTTLVEPVATPINLSATAAGAHAISLQWTDTSSDETGFRVEYRSPYGDWGTLINLPADTQSWLDEDGLEANQTRFYRVRARKGTAVSDPSNVAFATTTGVAVPNGRPTGLAAVAHDNVSIDISWIDNSSNEAAFKIEYLWQTNKLCGEAVKVDDSTPRSFFKWSVTVPRSTATAPVARTARVTGLIPHSAHAFRIYAINKDGESLPGLTAAATTDFTHTTTCEATLGPAAPIYKDPPQNGDVKATRCDVTLTMPVTGDFKVTKARLIVNAVISGGLASTRIIDVVAANDPNDGRFAITGNDWKINYKFRQGVSYRLIATAYGAAPNYYASPDATRYDVTVLADCPLEDDPLP